MKTIAIGADDAAYAFRDSIVAYLNGLGINVADYSSAPITRSTSGSGQKKESVIWLAK